MKSISPGHIQLGQAGRALDMHSLQQNYCNERLPATRNNLERALSVNSTPSGVQSYLTPTHQPEEQVSINLSNLGPAASPGSSSASSNIGSPLKPHDLPGATDSLPSIPPLEKLKSDEGDGNHVVDITPAESESKALGNRSLHEPSAISRIVDEAVIENPRALHEQVDRFARTDLSNLSEPQPPLHGGGNQPGAAQESAVTSAQIAPAARPSTRNAAAKKQPANRLGPSNALAGIRILLVEDTPVLAKVATIMLEKMGARVVAVVDGLQAVETIGRSRGDQSVDDSEAPAAVLAVDQFDLVLMDCQVANAAETSLTGVQLFHMNYFLINLGLCSNSATIFLVNMVIA